jgi:hypothetical protein
MLRSFRHIFQIFLVFYIMKNQVTLLQDRHLDDPCVVVDPEPCKEAEGGGHEAEQHRARRLADGRRRRLDHLLDRDTKARPFQGKTTEYLSLETPYLL